MIRPQRLVKYLGVWLDKLNYTKHLKRVIEKAGKSIREISRNLPNVGLPKNDEDESIIIYEVTVWIAILPEDTSSLLSRSICICKTVDAGWDPRTSYLE